MRVLRFVPLLFIAVFGCHCASSETAAPGPSSTPPSDDKCVPLDKMRASCPPDWAAAMEDEKKFCAENEANAMFDAAVSTEACRGQLRYSRYLFDGGPRYCLYDPRTKQLSGYGVFDGKAQHQEWSCGHARADYDDKGCAMATCKKGE